MITVRYTLALLDPYATSNLCGPLLSFFSRTCCDSFIAVKTAGTV